VDFGTVFSILTSFFWNVFHAFGGKNRHVSIPLIASFEVYYSDRLERPESQWTQIRVLAGDSAANLDNLRPATTYYVRIDVRNTDGTVLKGQQVYRFTTLGKTRNCGQKS
jgi:hypothetical protein